MARKKKLSRKEKNKQRRAAIKQFREERGWKMPSSPPAGIESPHAEMVEDMLPLLSLLKNDQPGTDELDELMVALVGSGDLIKEPEFEEIFTDPLRTTEVLAEVGQELDLTPEDLEQLPEDERAERQAEIIEETTRRLLSSNLRRDILEALNRLRLRLREAGDRQELARAAALQSFLTESGDDESWVVVGLVQAVVQRSLMAGFALMEVSMEAAEANVVDKDDTALTIRQKLTQSNAAQRAEEILSDMPGLSGFLEKQADQRWDEGVAALFQGELYLDLFTVEEIAGGAKIFQETLEGTSAGAAGEKPAVLPQETVQEVMERLEEHILEMITPERLAQVQDRIEAALRDPDYEDWQPFLFMLEEDLTEQPLKDTAWILARALVGELRVVSTEMAEAAGETD